MTYKLLHFHCRSVLNSINPKNSNIEVVPPILTYESTPATPQKYPYTKVVLKEFKLQCRVRMTSPDHLLEIFLKGGDNKPKGWLYETGVHIKIQTTYNH